MMNLIQRLHLWLTVFSCGAAVMVLEILGTRLTHPYFGVTLFVWASMIAVTLLSLALGYAAGGVLADRRPAPSWLWYGLLVAAFAVAVIPFMADKILKWTGQWDIRVGVLMSSFILFAFPLFLLGAVSPFAIKLSLQNLHNTGRVAGSLYALSTLGSLTGTLLAGFYLIPVFGLRFLFFLLAVLFSGLALTGIFLHESRRKACLLTGLAILILAFLFRTATAHGALDGIVIEHIESPYGQIKVVDYKGLRSLLVNGSPQNYEKAGQNPYNLFDRIQYGTFFASVLMMRPESEEMLMVGLGAGYVPIFFARQQIAVDVIEIDPQIREVAERYFRLNPEELRELVYGDGRQSISNWAGTRHYSAVFIDAFSTYEIPAHFFTVEMLQEVKSVLKSDGVLVINAGGSLEGETSRVPRAIAATLREKFQFVRIFEIQARDKVNNIVFYASDHSLEWNMRQCRLFSCEKQLALQRLLDRHDVTVALENGLILTDDYNPISVWGAPIHRDYRNRVVQFFGDEILSEI